MKTAKSIKALRVKLAALRAVYEVETSAIYEEIEEIRKERGTVIKTPVYESYHETGRCAEIYPGMSGRPSAADEAEYARMLAFR
jgi:hypothetical protein